MLNTYEYSPVTGDWTEVQSAELGPIWVEGATAVALYKRNVIDGVKYPAALGGEGYYSISNDLIYGDLRVLIYRGESPPTIVDGSVMFTMVYSS